MKSITAREIFKLAPSVKKQPWGGELWSKGYFVNTIGQKGNVETIANYVRRQGREEEYKKLHCEQLEVAAWEFVLKLAGMIFEIINLQTRNLAKRSQGFVSIKSAKTQHPQQTLHITSLILPSSATASLAAFPVRPLDSSINLNSQVPASSLPTCASAS